MWLGGAFSSAGEGLGSYAAGYPDEQDLFLAEAYSGESGASPLSYTRVDSSFVHLDVRSCFSLKEGAFTPNSS